MSSEPGLWALTYAPAHRLPLTVMLRLRHPSIPTRSCCIESRSRTVTVRSAQRIPVDRDAERRSRLVHAPVPPADGAAVVVEARRTVAEDRGTASVATSGMPSFFTSGNTPALIGATGGMQPQHDAGLAFDFLLTIGIDQQRQRHPVGAGGRLHDVRQIALFCAWSKYSSFLPEYSWWRPRSKSPRL